MATFSFQKTVYPGQVEYTASQHVENADILEVEFESGVVIDDMIIFSSDTLDVKLWLVFPMSGLTVLLSDPAEDITVAGGETWFLNTVSPTTSRRWYSLPAKTKVRLEITAGGSDMFLQWVLIGRPTDD